MMGFIKQQERKMAERLLSWHYEKNKLPKPHTSDLKQQAERLVDDAHRIARERGRNVLTIIKELIADIRKQDK